MPGGDRTGPMGAGPMTGRGAGFCSGSSQPGYGSQGVGRGFGRGGGRGLAWRNRFFAGGLPSWARWWNTGPVGPTTLGPEQEKQMLEQQARQLQESLDTVQSRIRDLDGNKS